MIRKALFAWITFRDGKLNICVQVHCKYYFEIVVTILIHYV